MKKEETDNVFFLLPIWEVNAADYKIAANPETRENKFCPHWLQRHSTINLSRWSVGRLDCTYELLNFRGAPPTEGSARFRAFRDRTSRHSVEEPQQDVTRMSIGVANLVLHPSLISPSPLRKYGIYLAGQPHIYLTFFAYDEAIKLFPWNSNEKFAILFKLLHSDILNAFCCNGKWRKFNELRSEKSTKHPLEMVAQRRYLSYKVITTAGRLFPLNFSFSKVVWLSLVITR